MKLGLFLLAMLGGPVSFAASDFSVLPTKISQETPIVLQPEVAFSNIYEYGNTAIVNTVNVKSNAPNLQSPLYYSQYYQDTLLTLLCNKLGYGKNLGTTYVNLTSDALYEFLIMAEDGNFVVGFEKAAELKQKYDTTAVVALNGFKCQLKKVIEE